MVNRCNALVVWNGRCQMECTCTSDTATLVVGDISRFGIQIWTSSNNQQHGAVKNINLVCDVASSKVNDESWITRQLSVPYLTVHRPVPPPRHLPKKRQARLRILYGLEKLAIQTAGKCSYNRSIFQQKCICSDSNDDFPRHHFLSVYLQFGTNSHPPSNVENNNKYPPQLPQIVEARTFVWVASILSSIILSSSKA